MKIANNTVMVTGANRGIGLALVEKALEMGAAKVYATYRSAENRSVLEALGGRVVPVHLDLADKASIAALAHAAPDTNILVNNAGLFTGGNLLNDSDEQTRNDIETNFFGTLAVTKAALPAIKAAGGGAIANVSSISALGAMPSFGGYSASKAALHSLTQSLRAGLAGDNITVHGVYPGPVETRLTEGFEMEKTPAPTVAANILAGIEAGDDEIFPDAMSAQLGPVFMTAPKQVETTFAAF
ncbi:MAG: SDR family oxidoreductase [Pseudomonadota bacterium]